MSSLSVAEMRKELLKQYGGAAKWRLRVLNMSEQQVIAVYQKMLGVNKDANNKR